MVGGPRGLADETLSRALEPQKGAGRVGSANRPHGKAVGGNAPPPPPLRKRFHTPASWTEWHRGRGRRPVESCGLALAPGCARFIGEETQAQTEGEQRDGQSPGQAVGPPTSDLLPVAAAAGPRRRLASAPGRPVEHGWVVPWSTGSHAPGAPPRCTDAVASNRIAISGRVRGRKRAARDR
jgi:hypothetical protein